MARTTYRHFATNKDDFDPLRGTGDSKFKQKEREFRNMRDNERDQGYDYTVRTEYTTYDYYKILDCHQNASEDHIKSQFRKLAFKFHPDSHINEGLPQARKDALSK